MYICVTCQLYLVLLVVSMCIDTFTVSNCICHYGYRLGVRKLCMDHDCLCHLIASDCWYCIAIGIGVCYDWEGDLL